MWVSQFLQGFGRGNIEPFGKTGCFHLYCAGLKPCDLRNVVNHLQNYEASYTGRQKQREFLTHFISDDKLLRTGSGNSLY